MKPDELEEFRKQCERNLQRSVADRMRYGFNYVYKPVMDDARWRSFDSMEEYRRWCRENLPKYLGYGETDELSQQTLDAKTSLIALREIRRRTKD